MKLMPLVYEELRRLARGFMARESRDHTLQPTALVNEAYLKLIDQTRVDWRGRSHFRAVGARVMRRILYTDVANAARAVMAAAMPSAVRAPTRLTASTRVVPRAAGRRPVRQRWEGSRPR